MQNRTSANIIGPDLNEYRGTVDYTLLATKTNYCYLRGSGNGSGKFREDKRFVEYAEGLKKVGIKSGAYHYAVPSYDLNTADAQCDDFINVLQKAYGQGKYGDLFPVIDIEAPTDKSISTDALLNWVDRFRKRFERKTRRVLMLYTGAFFIELYNNFYHSAKGFILSDMPLWIAMYPEIKPNPPYPKDQGGWTKWRLWQYTESGTMAGVNPPVDLNYGPVNLDLLTQPRDVKNLKAVTSGRNIRVTWTQNSDVDLAGYNIFLNSSYVTTLGKNSTEYTIELGPQTAPLERYEVSIEAFDVDGDFSPNRSKVKVEFKRGDKENLLVEEEFIPKVMVDNGEVKDDIRDIIDEDENSMRVEESLTYIDPVTRLENKFLGNLMRNITSEDEQVANRGLFEDFVETNDEFDDKLYLKTLEDETVYKSFYGEARESSHLDFYDTHEDEDEEDDYIYNDVKGQRHKKNHHCKENEKSNNHKKYKYEKDEDYSDSEEDYNESKECIPFKSSCKKANKEIDHYQQNCNCGMEISDVDKMQMKMKGYESVMEYEQCQDCKSHSPKERYEGDRRRSENRDSGKVKSICSNCTEGKEKCNSCEYLMYNMYLNNCDYGHKHSNDKKKKKHQEEYCEDKHDKKKKKKKKQH